MTLKGGRFMVRRLKHLIDLHKDGGLLGKKIRDMRMHSKNPIGGIGVARDDLYRNEEINKAGMNEPDTTIVAKAEKSSWWENLLSFFK